ncbi:DUF6470 family protein [Fodinisporobacter ferrooxydans]|uniref:DUF6470 family protein n=1 Tax=Fodinisporobacter ferrooxydans TaxID=2901836 RepID=A0ABY4CN32_9BACL|nr:DUF6470 family protein [Alicyclobacillaceae bacterium MYW30-H2]
MVPQLEIHQVSGLIAIHQTIAKIHIQQLPANMTIHQQPATMRIHASEGQLAIDQSEQFAEEGLMSSGQLEKQAAQDGHNAALAYIAKTAADGDQLKSDFKNKNAIADMAAKNSQPPVHDFNVGLIPNTPIHISYKSAPVQIDVQANNPQIHASPNPVRFHTELGKVRISMARYPSITIQVAGTQFDSKI